MKNRIQATTASALLAAVLIAGLWSVCKPVVVREGTVVTPPNTARAIDALRVLLHCPSSLDVVHTTEAPWVASSDRTLVTVLFRAEAADGTTSMSCYYFTASTDGSATDEVPGDEDDPHGLFIRDLPISRHWPR